MGLELGESCEILTLTEVQLWIRLDWGKSRGASEVASRMTIRCTPLIKLNCYTDGLASTEAALIKVGACILRFNARLILKIRIIIRG